MYSNRSTIDLPKAWHIHAGMYSSRSTCTMDLLATGRTVHYHDYVRAVCGVYIIVEHVDIHVYRTRRGVHVVHAI